MGRLVTLDNFTNIFPVATQMGYLSKPQEHYSEAPHACGANCELPEPGARNFDYLAPGWFNFACGANYRSQERAIFTKGGLF